MRQTFRITIQYAIFPSLILFLFSQKDIICKNGPESFIFVVQYYMLRVGD